MSTQEDNLKAIADAIRAKEGGSGTIPASQFASRIRALPAGGGAVSKVKLSNTYGYIEGNLEYNDDKGSIQRKDLYELCYADAFGVNLREEMRFSGSNYTVSSITLEGDTLNIALRGFSS